MKIKFLMAFFFCMSINISAQDWLTNFTEAKNQASLNNKNIVLVFQGSDWCAPCIKLDKQVWSTKEFQELANDHFIMLQADFPRKKSNQISKYLQEQNSKLAEQYNVQGYFPLVVVLNNEGDILGKMGYEKITPTEHFNKLTSFE